jgi:hypothetical protein
MHSPKMVELNKNRPRDCEEMLMQVPERGVKINSRHIMPSACVHVHLKHSDSLEDI